MHDDHGAMIDGEATEPALELVAIDDRGEAVRTRLLVRRQKAQVRCPAALLATLGVAGAHEESICPGLEAAGVPELGKVTPDGEQRLL